MPPKSSLTLEQASEFEQYLQMVIADEGFLPEGKSFNLSSQLFARYAAELVITDGESIYLTQYEKPWLGINGYWHIPGGFANNFSDTNTQALASRIARREFHVDVDVPEMSDLGVYWWNLGEHDDPKARPLSVYTFVKPKERPPESETGRFFRFEELPSPMIGGAHQAFFDNLPIHLGVARLKTFIS